MTTIGTAYSVTIFQKYKYLFIEFYFIKLIIHLLPLL